MRNEELRATVHRLMQIAAANGGTLDDVVMAIEVDANMLDALMHYAEDASLDSLKARLRALWAGRRREAN